MANIFKNSIVELIGQTDVVVYRTPVATTSTLIGLNVANVSNETITVAIRIYDQSEDTFGHLIKNVILPIGTSTVVIGGDQKVVLESLDELMVKSSHIDSVDVVVSILEMS
jgi:hypothetical protein